MEILNNEATKGKWKRINSNNINETTTKHIAEVIIDEKQDLALTGKKKTDHNTIFLKIAGEPKFSNKEKNKD